MIPEWLIRAWRPAEDGGDDVRTKRTADDDLYTSFFVLHRHAPVLARIERDGGRNRAPRTGLDGQWSLSDYSNWKSTHKNRADGIVVSRRKRSGEEVLGGMLYLLQRNGFKIEHLVFTGQDWDDAGRVLLLLFDTIKGKIGAPGRRSYIQCVIPERALGAQLILKDLEFRAVEVVRSADSDGDDSYRMVYRRWQHEDAVRE